MNVILFHKGKQLPEYLEHCLRQFRLFNPDVTVYFLTEHEHLSSPVFRLNNIFVVDLQKYVSDEVYILEALYGRGADTFWTVTLTRFVYIYNFMLAHKLKDVYIFENDVLLYTDLNTIHPIVKSVYDSMAITVGGEDKCMTGLMFVSKPAYLQVLIQYFIGLLEGFSQQELRRMYNLDMVNEMTLMRAFSKDYPDVMEFFPILPFGKGSEHFIHFNSIFDPASWGQYVGGTLDGVPGAKPDDHYIGQLLRKNPDFTVIWKEESKGRIPYFKYDSEEVRINNLHIHSKQLSKYMSI